MNTVKQKIKEYNDVSAGIYADMNGFNTIITGPAAADDEIQEFEKRIRMGLPDELKEFYQTIGSMVNKENEESYCFSIFSLPALTAVAREIEYTGLVPAPGLVNMILYSWGYDRPELEPGENLSAEEISFLNKNYTCFGWYRDDTVSESAYYLFFDMKGNFSELYYDQDDFDSLEKSLRKLLDCKIQAQPLVTILCRALDKTKQTMIEWNS